MAHMIDFSNTRANVAYVGETPWHQLGKKLTEDASLEVWCQEAGMEWEAKKAKVFFNDEDNTTHESENFIVYRSDTKKELGVCSDRYNIVQPKEVVEFYRDIVETQGFKLETMGCLDGGKRIWALARTGVGFRVNNTIDEVGAYLLLATSFDGSLATVSRFTSVRTVCQNTLTMGLNEKGNKISVSHSTKFDASKIKEELGIFENITSKMNEEVNEMAKRKVSDKEAMRFIIDILEGKDAKVEDISTRNMNIIKNVYDLYKGNGKGATLMSSEGTLWGAVNSVTEYIDHHVKSRSDNNRLRSAWFGTGEKAKNDAYAYALKLVA